MADSDKGERASRAAPDLLLALICLVAVWIVVTVRYRPSAPAPLAAPAGDFSARRAGEVLRGLIGDGAPRPVGSAAAAHARDLLLAAFRRLGYEPVVQEGTACHWVGNCAAVQNVVARRQGREAGNAVVLAAHYDSVGAGAGAADDLASVAALLEIARALAAGPPLRHSIWLLADGGEEGGLFGAQVFVRGLAPSAVAAAINLEARGTSGPSLMFQTGRDNARVVSVLARVARRPVTSSLFAAVYERLPNDTDFTVFRGAGMEGLNFAFIGDVARYHSAVDDLAHVSLGSLQHQGENALAVARGLADADLAARPRGAAIFFDFLAWRVLWWPAAWSFALALLGMALLAGGAVRFARRGLLSCGQLGFGLLAWLTVLAAGVVGGWALGAALAATAALPANWPADPRLLLAACALLPFGLAASLAPLFGRRGGAHALWLGSWLGWSAMAVTTTVAFAGASFLFTVPVLVAAAVLWTSRLGGGGLRPAVTIIPATLAACLWLPLAKLLYAGLGVRGLPFIAALVTALSTTLLPLFGLLRGRPRRAAMAMAGLAPLLAALMLAVPPYSPESPRKVDLIYHQDADTGRARWLVTGDLPTAAALRRLLPLAPQPLYPWVPDARVAGAAAPRLTLPAPELQQLAAATTGAGRRLRLRLVSHRGAAAATLALPPDARVEEVRVDGVPLPRRPDRALLTRGDWYVVNCLTVPAAGVEVELVLGTPHPIAGYIFDRSRGLPQTGQALAAARDSAAVQAGAGDVTVVSRRVVI